MNALQGKDAPREAKATRNLYTYLVAPKGVVLTISEPDEQLRFSARLSKSDGWSREQDVVVRNTEARPDLVARVREALSRAPSARMVITFERIARDVEGGVPHMRAIAVVENLLDPARAKASPQQLDLFA